MSTNHYIVCKSCKKCMDIAQGYPDEVRPTSSSNDIVSFLDKHRGHELMFVSENNEDILLECEEV